MRRLNRSQQRFLATVLVLSGSVIGLSVGVSFIRAHAQGMDGGALPPPTMDQPAAVPVPDQGQPAAAIPGAPPPSVDPTQLPPPPPPAELPPPPPTADIPPVPPAAVAPPTANIPPPPSALPVDAADPSFNVNNEGFIYNPEGLRDPFFPSRKPGERIAVDKPIEAPKSTEPNFDPKDPLQAFELREYRLVAILWDVREPKAMVSTPDGKVWTIRQKVRLGRAGAVVAAIRESEIVVVEPNPDGSYVNASTRVISIKK